MTSNEAIGYFVETFDNLYKQQGCQMAVAIRWAIGGGYLLITKDEWILQPDPASKAALIKCRAEALYQRLRQRPNQ